MRHLFPAVLVMAALAVPGRADAWGYDAHTFIAGRAIALLPAELRPFFEAHRASFVERSIDPDTWRTAGFDAAESPRHFFHVDWEAYGPDPSAGMLRDHDAAVARWGRAAVEENGTLPWRAEEMHGRLRSAFESYARRGSFGRYDIVFFAAWLAHYVSDAHVPFHAVVNYDGQLTGQRGIHARFEAMLFERTRARLDVDAVPREPEPRPRDAVFEALLEGGPLAATVLAADARAREADRGYGDAYYDAFFAGSRGVLEQRLEQSIAAVAAMIAGAWEAAGRPPVPVRRP
jgi:hypothetical protein